MPTPKIIRSDFNGLNNLVKALSDNRVVNVGILSKKTGRKDKGGINNAEIGAVMEFGKFTKPRIPARSWLRMPIHQEAETIARDAGRASATLVQQGNQIGVLKLIGIACENAIQRAFDTTGFGRWAANKPSTIRAKKSSSPLIDTAQFRRSVSSEVKKVS